MSRATGISPSARARGDHAHPPGWSEANQAYLRAHLKRLRLLFAGRLDEAAYRAEDFQAVEAGIAESRESLGRQLALDLLCEKFALSAFERDVLLFAAAPELDGGWFDLFVAAQGSARPYPILATALEILPEAHWSALTPEAPLRGGRLCLVDSDPALTTARLRVSERILHYLMGTRSGEPLLAGMLERVPAPVALPPSQEQDAQDIARILRGDHPPVVQLVGAPEPEKRPLAARAARALGLGLGVISAGAIPDGSREREDLVRYLEREALLDDWALYVECAGQENQAASRRALTLAGEFTGPRFLACREPLPGPAMIRRDVRKPTTQEQLKLWRQNLGPSAADWNGDLERIVSQFNLGSEQIAAAARAAAAGESAEIDSVWRTCRVQSRSTMEDLAARIEGAAEWNDLVLPAAGLNTLREITRHIRHRMHVYERWGFARKGTRGLGISALFAGPSGTGKTLAAEIIAAELELDLYRIDLSSIVSKYIGETEKNLRRVFDAAEGGGAVLLFDEADALFGKRSEIKDSHDRYANIEVSYLLQRMEEYRGLAILTTNLKSAVDTAFLRRLRFIVQFPFPDAAGRAEIWRRVFPAATPIEGLDPERLGRLNVSGGNIRNIALNAAFIAADGGGPVRMEHIFAAARDEYRKLEKTISTAEFGGDL